MPTPQENKKDIMAKVNGIVAALNLYPELDPTNSQLSFSMSANPIDLLVDFFKLTKGYDWLINVISKFIAFELPALELAVKGVLLSNIRIMLSCSVSPIITRKMINDGVVIDLNKTDLMNVLSFSPLNKSVKNPGRYYYFGCDPEDGINMIDDLKFARDFNAVLWYAKNTPGERIVWRREGDKDKPLTVSRINEHEWTKQVKSNGIATLEFNGRSSGLKKADGGSHMIQEPIDNCLHVFIGYCAPQEMGSKNNEISECTRILAAFDKFSETIDDFKDAVKYGKKTSKSEAKKYGANTEVLNKIDRDTKSDLHILDRLKSALDGIDIDNPQSTQTTVDGIMGGTTFELNTIHENIEIPPELCNTSTIITKAHKIDLMQQNASRTLDYPSAKSNYYLFHPLIEWNTDFIMSVKLFDAKVVAAQLLDALTKCIDCEVGFNANIQLKYIQSQIRDLVTKIIESDEGTVSDCFFSFSNDSYNSMLNEVELNRANLHSINDNTVNNIPSVSDVMDSLNTISHDATQEELQSAISSSLFSAATSTGSEAAGDMLGSNVDFNANFTIIDNLLTQLTYVIVSIVLQPKVYTLLMINLALMGDDPNFDLAKFIQQFGDLISALIKEIRDHILEYFTNELLKVLNDLIKALALKLSLEQYQYYVTLLTHCIACLKIHRGEFDWIQDGVNYADITELNQTENQEC